VVTITTAQPPRTAPASGQAVATAPPAGKATVTGGFQVRAEVPERTDPDAERVAKEAMEYEQELQEMMRRAEAEMLAEMTPEERAQYEREVAPPANGKGGDQDDGDGGTEAMSLTEIEDELSDGEPAQQRYGSGELASMWVQWLAKRLALAKGATLRLTRAEAIEWSVKHGRSESWADGKLAELLKDGHACRLDGGIYELTTAPPDPFRGGLFEPPTPPPPA
jgi:hypothetical protein